MVLVVTVKLLDVLVVEVSVSVVVVVLLLVTVVVVLVPVRVVVVFVVVVCVMVVVVDAIHSYWAKYTKLQPSIQMRASLPSLPLKKASLAFPEMHVAESTGMTSGHVGV